MKLLLDQGLPRTATALLVSDGHDSVHVGEIGLFAASDADILGVARDQGRTVVTLDADFHALLAQSGAGKPSVIWIRTEGLRAPAMVSLLKNVILQLQRGS